ncbi:MAG: hypothetical protein ACOC2W_04765 [bacterium]
MSIVRTYLTKNNTIIKNNRINNSQNPVTEISYGLKDSISRYIFHFDLDSLKQKILDKGIEEDNIISHKIKFQNTINLSDNYYIGGFFQDENTQRTSSLKLDLFEINEEWDEGNGYELYYYESEPLKPIFSASNWYDRKTNDTWEYEGIYNSGTTNIIGEQSMENGNENIDIDITNYINDYVFDSVDDYEGFGLKFADEFEQLETTYRQAIAFHTKYTHTFFQPYIETIIDDNIFDDRNSFVIDKDNRLYLYLKNKNVTVNSVEIFDYNNELIDTLFGDDIKKVQDGIFYINYSVSSLEYPDRVIFYDKWSIKVDGFERFITEKFYINHNLYDEYLDLNPDNYHIKLSGIKYGEKIKNKEKRPININIRRLYDDDFDIDVYYDLYIKMTNSHIIKIVDFNKVNKIKNKYFFELDTTWLLPQDYYIDLYIFDGGYKYLINTYKFSVIDEFEN